VSVSFLLYNILLYIGILYVHIGRYKGEYLISICRPVPRSIPSKSWMRTASSLSSESFLYVGIRVCPVDRHIWYRALRTVSAAWIEIDPGTMLGTGRSRTESARVYVETSARDWHPTAPLETVKTFHPVSRRVWPWRFVATPIILLGRFTVIRKTGITRRVPNVFDNISFHVTLTYRNIKFQTTSTITYVSLNEYRWTYTAYYWSLYECNNLKLTGLCPSNHEIIWQDFYAILL